MLNRYSILCFATGTSLLAAKIASVAANPLSASTGSFPQLAVVAVVFALDLDRIARAERFGRETRAAQACIPAYCCRVGNDRIHPDYRLG